jgi:hypothetical protein
MTDNLATVLENEIVTVLGRLLDLTAVNAALMHTLALP